MNEYFLNVTKSLDIPEFKIERLSTNTDIVYIDPIVRILFNYKKHPSILNLLSPGTSNDFPPSESNMGIPNDTRGPTDVYIRECGDTARARLKYRFYLLSAQGRIYTQLRSMLSAQGRIYTSNHVYILICLGCSIRYFKLTFGRLWRFTMQ